MLETANEKLQYLNDKVRDHAYDLTHEQPDDANAGISKAESGLALVAALGTAYITRELLKIGWRTALDREPPQNPASHEVEWKEALLWGATAGALVGMARIASRRTATGAYRKFVD